jgi:TolB protein
LAYCASQGISHVSVEIVSLHNGKSRQIPLPPAQGFPGGGLKWSPDGRYFAYATAWDDSMPASQICTVRVSDHKIFEVTNGKTLDLNPTWSADGRRLYFLSNRGGSMDLWQQSLTVDGMPFGRPKPLTVGLEMRYAVFSPDGKRLAYSKGRSISNLWRIPHRSDRVPTWADATQLTFDQYGLTTPTLSPDLKHLAFTLFRDGRRQIWLLPTKGGDLQRLLTHPMDQMFPLWSPDGNSISFHSDEVVGDANIWVAPVRGGALTQLTRSPGLDVIAKWDPDGERLAFTSNRSGNWDVWTVSVGTGQEQQMTKHEGMDQLGSKGVWSPDGREIVFISDRTGNHDIWIISVDDRKERQVTSGPERESMAQWSPTGEWILYFLPQAGPRNSMSGRLWRVRPSGGQPEPLPVGSRGGIWSRDGKKIYFHLGPTWSLGNISEISVDGGPERMLTDLKDKYGSLLGFDTDGQYFYFNWLEDVGDLWVMDVKSGR